MQESLYGRSFYACFANGDNRDEEDPFHYHNEYELVSTGMVDPFLKQDLSLFAPDTEYNWFAGKEQFDQLFQDFKESGLEGKQFRTNKLHLIGRQQIYYADVRIESCRIARRLGEYRKWYRLTFSEQGEYACKVWDHSAPDEAYFQAREYRCEIERVPKKTSDFLLELYRVYPDGEHIQEGRKEKHSLNGPLGALVVGNAVHTVRVNHCTGPYYLCVEFLNVAGLPIGLFDMGYQFFAFQNYRDQGVPAGGWADRLPITVFISHFHHDHVNGLHIMVNSHNQRIGNTYHYFFGNMVIHMPNTYQPPSFAAITAAIAGAGGNVLIYNELQPFGAPNAAFDFGLGSFNHPVTGAYYPHPHLHGMYVRCTTAQGQSVLITGDTVYRGIGPGPGAGDLAGPYDVLVACHHGGDYAVSIAGNHLPAGILHRHYIPVSNGAASEVIYSSNGNGAGHHPAAWAMQDHQNQGWPARRITNAQDEYIN